MNLAEGSLVEVDLSRAEGDTWAGYDGALCPGVVMRGPDEGDGQVRVSVLGVAGDFDARVVFPRRGPSPQGTPFVPGDAVEVRILHHEEKQVYLWWKADVKSVTSQHCVVAWEVKYPKWGHTFRAEKKDVRKATVNEEEEYEEERHASPRKKGNTSASSSRKQKASPAVRPKSKKSKKQK